ncbi:MAG: 8-amino-7-oxononanoate synthase [Myxococcota bacterium]
MPSPRERLRASLQAGLDARRDAGLLRTLVLPGGVDLTSNDVLDFAHEPWLVARVAAAVSELGVGSGASRLLRGHSALLASVESRLAAFSGREAALLFPSGYQANATVIPALVGPDDAVFSDAANHASIIDGIRLSGARKSIFPHGDLSALESALGATSGGRRLIVIESLYSMDGDRAPLAAICDLAERHDALVMVDEAHATGLFGGRGSGLVEAAGLSERVAFTLHTGGKALGVGGAWVAGDAELVAHLVNHCRGFIYTTAPPTPVAAGLDAALELLGRSADRVARVHAMAERLRRSLRGAGLDLGLANDHIVPVMAQSTARAVSVADALARDGFDVRAVRPPTVPEGTARLRLSVRASLDAATIDRLAARIIGELAAGAP